MTCDAGLDLEALPWPSCALPGSVSGYSTPYAPDECVPISALSVLPACGQTPVFQRAALRQYVRHTMEGQGGCPSRIDETGSAPLSVSPSGAVDSSLLAGQGVVAPLQAMSAVIRWEFHGQRVDLQLEFSSVEAELDGRLSLEADLQQCPEGRKCDNPDLEDEPCTDGRTLRGFRDQQKESLSLEACFVSTALPNRKYCLQVCWPPACCVLRI